MILKQKFVNSERNKNQIFLCDKSIINETCSKTIIKKKDTKLEIKEECKKENIDNEAAEMEYISKQCNIKSNDFKAQ